jgi:hypothetical protein
MSKTALQTLIGTALIDRRFCEELLNGKRPALLAEFDLSEEEREVALIVETDSIQEFAVGLYERLAAC